MGYRGFLFFLLQGKTGDARAVLKAHRDFRKMRKAYTEFPDKDIMKDIPGTSCYIYKDYLF